MIVCICHSISKCQIKKSLSRDCKDFKDIQSKLKVEKKKLQIAVNVNLNVRK